MAFNIMRFFKFGASIILRRSVRPHIKIQKSIQISTSQILSSTSPVKFTTSKAAKVQIEEILGLKSKKSSRFWLEKYIVLASLSVLLVYYCAFREENDIDEILKGNANYLDPGVEIVKLRMILRFYEKNNLPTSALKFKIKELEEKVKPHSF